MKQKIGIIQALMGRAPVLILDEPTAGLDPLMIQAFTETLRGLKAAGRTTIFLSSHVLAEVEHTCDRLGVVRGGQLVTVGTVDDLRRRAPRRVTIRVARTIQGGLPPIAGVTVVAMSPMEYVFDVIGPLGPVLQALTPWAIDDVREEPFKLEHSIVQFYTES
jgi:ABC-2 type transport system ATP-binding protein